MKQPLVTTGRKKLPSNREKHLWQNHTLEGATFCREWIRVREGKQNKRHIPKERQRSMLTND